jgi:hypothetical protein
MLAKRINKNSTSPVSQTKRRLSTKGTGTKIMLLSLMFTLQSGNR